MNIISICAAFLALTSICFLLTAAHHHWLPRRPTLALSVPFPSLPFSWLWVAYWSSAVLLLLGMSGLSDSFSLENWSLAMSAAGATITSVIWMMVRRTYTYRSAHFEFTFRRDSREEVSVHVKLRLRSSLGLPRGSLKRRQVVELGLAEFPQALSQAANLPKEVTTLTFASPWFGFGRHKRVRASLEKMLTRAFPHKALVPVSRSLGFSYTTLLLASRLGWAWRRHAKGPRVSLEGFSVRLKDQKSSH